MLSASDGFIQKIHLWMTLAQHKWHAGLHVGEIFKAQTYLLNEVLFCV